MEENKYLCPKCGTEMNSVYEKPALNLTCPKCNCKIAITKWEEIDLDDEEYKIILSPISNPTVEKIKVISTFTGLNYFSTTNLFKKGGIMFLWSAIDTLEKKKILDGAEICYKIIPDFKY